MYKSYNTQRDREITERSRIEVRVGRVSYAGHKKQSNIICASALSGKEREPIMKNTNKSFSQSLRGHLREGFILYAAANSCFPMNADLMKLYKQTIDGEMN